MKCIDNLKWKAGKIRISNTRESLCKRKKTRTSELEIANTTKVINNAKFQKTDSLIESSQKYLFKNLDEYNSPTERPKSFFFC